MYLKFSTSSPVFKKPKPICDIGKETLRDEISLGSSINNEETPIETTSGSSRRRSSQRRLDLQPRRSLRLSMKQTHEERRRSTRASLTKHNEINETSTTKKRKTKNLVVSNDVIRSYINNTNTKGKNNQAKHKKAILDFLNKGSMREIQILPQVGLKTAYQIITQR